MSISKLKLSVILISFALGACGGGGDGVSTGSTPTGGGNNNAGQGSSTVPSSVPVPMPSENPSLSDSHEKAADISEPTNKFENNKFGQPNNQANHLNLKDAFDENLNGSGVKVGLVDGAISSNNPALPEIVNHGVLGKSENTQTDHATAVALAIGGRDVNGNVLGIAKKVQLHVADASAEGDTISRNASIKALYALYNSGVRIINNSYGFSNTYKTDANDYLNAKNIDIKSRTYIGQLKKLTDNDTLLIWAAGNDGALQPTSESLLPLAEPELQKGFITVVGVNDNNTINNQSNKCGDAKNWCMAALWKFNTANVHAANEQQLNEYALSTTAGTSMAAPQVTAAAALVKQKFPWMTNNNLRTTLLTTATDLGAKGVDSVYGWGLLNIGKAVNGPAQFAFGDFDANVGSGTYVFNNDISGDGGLIKNGSGQLTLSGNNTYSGITNINSGTLLLTGSSVSPTNINNNGVYAIINGKSGAINNNGTLFSSDAVINGNYLQGANSKLETLIGAVTTINGNAILDGKLSFTGIKAGYIPKNGARLDVLNANTVNGKFSSTDIDNKLLLDGTTVYTTNSVKLDINRVSTVQATKDHLSLANENNNAIRLGARALDSAFNQLDEQLLSNDVNVNTLSFANGASKLQNVTTPKNLATSLYSLSGSIYSNGVAINSLIQDRLNQDFLSYLDTSSNNIETIIQFNHMNNHWSPKGLNSKQSTNSGLIGAVKRLNESLIVGGAYAYHQTNLSQGLSGYKDDMADIKSNSIMTGAKYQPKNWDGLYIKGTFSYDNYSNKVNRLITLNDESFNTGTKSSGDLWQWGLLAGKQFVLNDLLITPQMGLRYDYIHQNAFNENGAYGFGLNANGLDKGILSGTFSIDSQYNFNIKNKLFSIFGLISVNHDFNSRKFITKGGFSGMPNNNITAGYWILPKNRWTIGTGLNVELAKNIKAGISYRYEKGSSSWMSNRINANLAIGL